MELNREEKSLLIEVINHAIAYRLNNGTRKSEITTLKNMKKKIEENLPLSECCNAKTKRGLKLSQDSHNIYCTRCNKKQNYLALRPLKAEK